MSAFSGPVQASEDHCRYCFEVLLAKLDGKSLPEPKFHNNDAAAPLFVTWKVARTSDLRGCIGNFSDLHLGKGLADYALTSALHDTRFRPIEKHEVPDLAVAVSLLIEFEKAAHAYDWEVGVHGIRIAFKDPVTGGKRNATFLPEVAAEQNWTHEETLHALVRKSGCKAKLADVVHKIDLVRYKSSKASLKYQDFCK